MTPAILLGIWLMLPGPAVNDTLANGFRNVPTEAKMRLYWRVFGPAWDRENIDYQLELLKKADVGGVTVYFMYPYAVDDPSTGILNQTFGSPEFLDTWNYAATRAKASGLRFGLNGSTGWPYGGPTVQGKDAAQRIYEKIVEAGSDTSKELTLKDGEKVLAVFQDGVDVTRQWRSGSLSATTKTRFYITGPTGMRVKRAANGAAGLVLSHYDIPALERYLQQVIEPILHRSPGLLESLGCDSLEVYNSNWTDDLPREFKKRRGYDLIPVLPRIFGAGGPERFDFWRTLAELTEERFTKTLGNWCDKHGLNLEMEAYGTPPNPMTAYRYIHVPTGEHYEWKGFSIQKYVASAANQCRRRIIGSEAWTWAGIPNRLIDSLSDIKLVSDMAFVGGANDLTGVDFAYSPKSAGSPGWLPYYGPVFSQNNPQWAYFHALSEYLNRCQWMLRQGKPVRNVVLYLPVEDSLEEGPPEMMLLDFHVRDRLVTGEATSEFGLQNALKHHSDVVHSLISHGYDFDGIDFWSMNRLAKVIDHKLVAGDAAYSALVLPNLKTLEPEAARKIVSFCQAGGIVVATRQIPIHPAGRNDTNDVQPLMESLFGSTREPGKVRTVGQGKAIFVEKDAQVAEALRPFVAPDVVYSPPQSTVGYVHRKSSEADIYFFSNVGPDAVTFTPTFGLKTRRIELWDALRGTMEYVDGDHAGLHLPPRGSLFVIVNPKAKNGVPRKSFQTIAERELAVPWKVDFTGPDAPPASNIEKLISWTELPGGEFFSGLAHYTTILPRPSEQAARVLLRFENVREAAEVRVNGKSAGILITPPWEVDITSLLNQADNKIEVTVANLLVNRVIGQPDIDLTALRNRYGAQFSAPEEKQLMTAPAPSGLIGRVCLVLQKESP